MTLVIYFSKFINVVNGTKKIKKRKSQPEETIAKGVKLITRAKY